MAHSNGSCPHCGQPVLLARTAAGLRQYLEPDPDPTGNTAAYRDHTRTWRSRRPTDEYPLLSYERIYMPHYATSPACRERAIQLAHQRKPPTGNTISNARSNYRRIT